MSAILHLLAGMMGGLTLTQKGYGHIYGSSGTANLAMSYANVDGGSAPSAGDLVVWVALAGDTLNDPMANLTGAGWTQADAPTWDGDYDIGGTIVAKVVSAGDISSPANIVTGPTAGSVGFWAAYSVAGTISHLAIQNPQAEISGPAAPSDQSQNSTGSGYSWVITLALGGGNDDTISLAMSGATPSIDYASSTNLSNWLLGGIEERFQAALTAGGANITISKGDDGTGNHLVSAHVGLY